MTGPWRRTPFVQTQPRPEATGLSLGHNNKRGQGSAPSAAWPSFDLVRQTWYAVTGTVADQGDGAVRKPVPWQKLAVARDLEPRNQPALVQPTDGQDVYVRVLEHRRQGV